MSNYIVEAFKAMSLLESEDISLNADGYDKLSGFMDEAGVDPDEEMTDVYDLEADAQDELKQSYIGKVVMECSVCHSDVFVDKSEVSVGTDEEGLACYDIECPYCMSNEGFTIIGEVAPYNAEESEALMNPEDDDMPDVDIEGAVDDVDEEDLDEAYDPNGKSEGTAYDPNGKSEGHAYDPNGKSDGHAYRVDEAWESEFESDYDRIMADNSKSEEEKKVELERLYSEYGMNESLNEAWEQEFESEYDRIMNNPDSSEEEKKAALKQLFNDYKMNESVEPPLKGDGEKELYDNQEIRGVDGLKGVKELEGDDRIRGPLHKTHVNEGKDYTKPENRMSDEQKLKRGQTVNGKRRILVKNADGTTEYKTVDADLVKESLMNEGIDATIDTDDQTISISSGDDGSVSVDATPKTSGMDFDSVDAFPEDPMLDSSFGGEEMIAPLQDDTVEEVEAAADANSIEEGEEDIEYTDLADEEGDFMDFDEFDEDSFNGLGESYLRECYDNVTSFKTTGVSVENNKLMVEGVIKFDSGNMKETEFVFESVGKGKFEGYNKHISRGKKTYKLATSMDNKKLVCESLNYNYRTKNDLNESVRVYGTVKRKK